MARRWGPSIEKLRTIWFELTAVMVRSLWRQSKWLLHLFGWRSLSVRQLERRGSFYRPLSSNSAGIAATFSEFEQQASVNIWSTDIPVGLWTLENATVPHNTKFPAIQTGGSLLVHPRREEGPFNYYGTGRADAASGIYAQDGEDVLAPPVRVRRGVDEAVYVGMRAPHNWGHWLSNFLPGVMLASELFDEEDSPPLVVPYGHVCSASRAELFHHFWGQRPILELGPGQELRAARLFWLEQPVYDSPRPSNAAKILPKAVNVETMTRFRDRILRFAKVEDSHNLRTRNLFLARGSSRDYGVTAVNRIAAQHGFEVVYPEKLSIAEQVSMFSQARRVAGPMGSAFANILFSGPGTEALILLPSFPPIVEDWWAPFAAVSGAKISASRGETLTSRPYLLDVEEVRARLSSFIAE